MLNRLKTMPQDRAVELIRRIASRLVGADFDSMKIFELQVFYLLEKEGILHLDDDENVIMYED